VIRWAVYLALIIGAGYLLGGFGVIPAMLAILWYSQRRQGICTRHRHCNGRRH
jgi:hypothetical protein